MIFMEFDLNYLLENFLIYSLFLDFLVIFLIFEKNCFFDLFNYKLLIILIKIIKPCHPFFSLILNFFLILKQDLFRSLKVLHFYLQVPIIDQIFIVIKNHFIQWNHLFQINYL